MRLLQCGVAFSPNVGDGLIASCMAYGLERLMPGAEMRSLDLAGREGFAAPIRGSARGGLMGRAGALRVLRELPGPARRFAVRTHLLRRLAAIEPQWTEMVAEADAVIIGGGQLFADADLNFPLKIGRLAQILAAAGVPVAIHAAGATARWSDEGAGLFGALEQTALVGVGLRDDRSIQHWREEAGFGPAPRLALDPGLLTADAFPSPPPAPDAPIGLGIADSTLLAYHAEGGVAGGDIGFQAALAAALAGGEDGGAVLLFCNGAEEDARALDRVFAHPLLSSLVQSGRVRAAPRPLTPEALARTVAGCRGIIAHRLHALIAAHAYALPTLALGWDEKVASFHALAGRGAYTVTDPSVTPDATAAIARLALRHPVDLAARAALADSALADLAETLALLGVVAASPLGAAGQVA
ncbi:MAG: polysaccharide pyruvyl transferase family protein [Pseudomonadota bacterium]